jgi:hypothetical protein
MGIDERVKQVPERRKHRRCELDDARASYCTGILALIGLNKRKGCVYDLSEEGVCIRTEEHIKRGTRVRVEISIEKPKENIRTYGVVCRSIEKDNAFYTGIRFADLDPLLRTQLKSMCDYFNSPTYKNLRQQRLEEEPWRKLLK